MLAEAFAILIMLAILSVLIIVHEFGHFSVARFFGFQTPIFGFGLPFGPSWVIGKKWDTEFRIHALMLGGYVAIPELGDESNLREDAYGVPLKPFKKFPIWQRALVAAAGVAFNIIFAWIVMFVMLATFGEPVQSVVVKQLPPENPIAANAGMKVNDRVLAINDHQVSTPEDVVGYLSKKPNTPIVVHVQRGKEKIDVPMTTNENGKVGMALVPKGPIHYNKIDSSPVALAGATTDKLVRLTGNMLDALGQMVSNVASSITNPKPKPAPGSKQAPQMGIEDVHGVLAVVAIGAEIAKQDWSQLFLFTIMISLDLAIINLLPYPALDGGHLAFMAWEAIRGKPMHERYQGEIVKWGFISLLVLMAVIMFNDVKALVTGKLTLKQDKEDEQVETVKPAPNTPSGGAATDKPTLPPATGTKDGAAPTDPAAKPAPAESSTEAPKPAPDATAPAR